MRKTEYRAWDKNTGRMFTGHGQYGVAEPDTGVRTSSAGAWTRLWEALARLDEDEDIVLMQYIGLRDAVGWKMFEGDVVDILDPTTRPEPIRGVITWDERVTGFEAMCPGKGYGLYLHAPYAGIPHDRTIRVVGNIYNNPGLIDQPATAGQPAEAERMGRKIRA